MNYETRHCAHCGTALQPITLAEDGGDKERLRCPACGWTHWNNPTPVLAAIVEVGGKVLLARNAAWPGKMFALITGFMEAGESPQEGIAREVKEETNLDVRSATLVGAYEFLRMNQVIIAYHVVAEGEVRLSPELVDYRLYDLPDLKCWPAGTGYALADWLRSKQAPAADAARLVLSLREGNQPLRIAAGNAHAVWVLHGPEGGLTAQEEDWALERGWQPASLGNRVLRAETASVAALSLLALE